MTRASRCFTKYGMALLQCRCLHILSGPRRSFATALIIPLVSARYMPLQVTTGFRSFLWLLFYGIGSLYILYFKRSWLLQERSGQDRSLKAIESNIVFNLLLNLIHINTQTLSSFFILHYHSFSPHYNFFLLFILTHASLRIILSNEGDAVSIDNVYVCVQLYQPL